MAFEKKHSGTSKGKVLKTVRISEQMQIDIEEIGNKKGMNYSDTIRLLIKTGINILKTNII